MKKMIDLVLTIVSNIAFDSAINSVTEASAKGVYQPSTPKEVLSVINK